ncbi:MAG: hypothetical protein ACREBB_03955 [Nitrosotalea sp.]
MARKIISLQPPFRFIDENDRIKKFQNEFSDLNKIDLSYLVEINEKDLYVIVRELNDDILAFTVLRDWGTHFEIKLVERNRDPSLPDIKPGAELIILAEDISRQFNYKKLVLYSVENRISYYKKLGYVEKEIIVIDPVYGTLTKMEKNLA